MGELNFEELYNKICAEYKDRMLEYRERRIIEWRNECIRIYKIAIIITIFISIYFLFVLHTLALYFFVIETIIFLVAWCIADSDKFYIEFKNNVIGDIVKNFGKNLVYDYKKGFSKEEYLQSGFGIQFDKFQSEDYLSGFLKDGTEYRSSEIILRKHEERKGSSSTNYRKVFEGVVIQIKLPTNINSKIIIKDNQVSTRFDYDRIEVESAEFEKYFDLFATNKVEALSIITTDVIDRINRVYYSQGVRNFQLVIKNDLLSISYELTRSYLEYDFSEPFEKERLKAIYNDIGFNITTATELGGIILNQINLTK